MEQSMEQSMAKAFHLQLQSCSRFNDPFRLGSSLEFSIVLAPTGLLGSGIFVLFWVLFVWVCPLR